VGLLACRYHGQNQPEPVGSFAAAATFAPAPIAATLNRAKLVLPTPPGSITHCPADFEEQIVLLFVYADTRVLNVNVAPAGCEFAINGDRGEFTPQSVLSTLEATLGHDREP
jgi:hypothetical protein